jgi:hypothetical protein
LSAAGRPVDIDDHGVVRIGRRHRHRHARQNAIVGADRAECATLEDWRLNLENFELDHLGMRYRHKAEHR